jgi:hypothetical protein
MAPVGIAVSEGLPCYVPIPLEVGFSLLRPFCLGDGKCKMSFGCGPEVPSEKAIACLRATLLME